MDVQKLESFASCSICFEIYREPRCLPCGHSYCSQCIQDLLNLQATKDSHTLVCPLCRDPTVVKGEATLYPISSAANASVDMIKIVRMTSSELSSSTHFSSPNNNNNPAIHSISEEWVQRTIAMPPAPFTMAPELRDKYLSLLLPLLPLVKDLRSWTFPERKALADHPDTPGAEKRGYIAMYAALRCYNPGNDDFASLLLNQGEEKEGYSSWVFIDSRYYLYKTFLNSVFPEVKKRGPTLWREFFTFELMNEQLGASALGVRKEFFRAQCMQFVVRLMVYGLLPIPGDLPREQRDKILAMRLVEEGCNVVPVNLLGGVCYNGTER